MNRNAIFFTMILLAVAFAMAACARRSAPALAQNSACVRCHSETSPGLVKDHLSGKMGKAGMDCSACHGSDHMDAGSVDKVRFPGVKTCGGCHPKVTEQFMAGKHAFGWAVMAANPIIPLQPRAAIEGLKGCGGCHKVGLAEPADHGESRFGTACDSCHTRHKFSRAEAKRPEACLPCHQGVGYIQWDAWSHSKHGVIYAIEGDTGRAPSCRTCHMQAGDHGVMTGWGELAVLTESDDPAWQQDRAAIFKYLQAFDPDGNPTPVLEGALGAKMLRSSAKEWSDQRDRMTRTCTQCHSPSYARKALDHSDQLIRQTDRLVARAIETVADLYRRGILQPETGQPAYPNLGMLYEARTPIEQRLYRMVIDERGAVIHGAFHMDPCYVTWEGQGALKNSLLEIQAMAREMTAH